jgi:hypothetical protein
MKNKKIILGVVLMVIFTISTVNCFGQNLNSPEALKEYLNKQPANSPDKPIKVSIGANELMLPKIVAVLRDTGKYVNLNLSGNALTSIPDNVFYDEDKEEGCETLVNITIPNSVIIIGDWAFKGCINLASVTIPDSVTSIGWCAFADCEKLTKITIPKSVTSIGGDAFNGCISLTSVKFECKISSDNFGTYDRGWKKMFSPFMGDLRDKYLAGGIGTYTTTPVPAGALNWNPALKGWDWNPVWTKQ